MEICNKEFCTGCSTCAEICPKGCITMFPDKEGFLRPSVTQNLCISCGLCQKTCPVNNPPEDDGKEPLAYAARHRDENILKISSSGGAFSALAVQILAEGGAVIGAGFNEQHMVVHKVCSSVSSLNELRRSKYVQSDIHGTFGEAQTLLLNGKKVLFCGTPCQVAGIKAYLGRDFPNLYTVDFICHGVPSPAAWTKYLEFQKNKVKSAVRSVSFRSKTTGWKNYSLKITFVDEIMYTNTVGKDNYLRSFIMDMDLRPSCYQCQFKQIHRQADITLADFWGSSRLNTHWNDDAGVSLVLVHSEKGRRLLHVAEADLDTKPVPFTDAVAGNPSMTHSVRKPALRDRFMTDLHRMPFDKLHEKYCGTGLTARIRRKVAQNLDRLK